jgi:hypothetical protein
VARPGGRLVHRSMTAVGSRKMFWDLG